MCLGKTPNTNTRSGVDVVITAVKIGRCEQAHLIHYARTSGKMCGRAQWAKLVAIEKQ